MTITYQAIQPAWKTYQASIKAREYIYRCACEKFVIDLGRAIRQAMDNGDFSTTITFTSYLSKFVNMLADELRGDDFGYKVIVLDGVVNKEIKVGWEQ